MRYKNPTPIIDMVLSSIIWGAVSGAGYSVNGWFSKAKKSDSKFDGIKFGTTVIVGAVIGAIAAYSGVTFDMVQTNLVSLGVLTTLEVGATAFIIKLSKKIKTLY